MLPVSPIVVAATIGVMAACVVPAAAQGGGQRSGGLFGATRSDTANRNQLNVLFSVSEGFDSDVPAEVQSEIPINSPQSGGFSTMLTTSADYLNAGRRLQFGGTAQSTFRYYQHSTGSSTSYSGALQARLRVSRNSTLQIRQTAAYSPSYWSQLFPTAALPGLEEPIFVDQEYRVQETESYSYGTSVEFGAGSPRGSRFTVSGDYGRTDFRRQATERAETETSSGRARYSFGVGRSALLFTEYEYRVNEMGFAAYTEHRINIGGRYSRALSSSRRMTFRFDFGPSVMDGSLVARETLGTDRVRRIQGSVAVDYQFLRTWRASSSYHRGAEYVAVLTVPVFSDSARADLSGLIGRRVDVSISGAYSDGESAVLSRGQLETYTGTARVRFALTRGIALYSEYFLYSYDLRRASQLAPELPRTYERHGIRVGVMLWVPVF